MQWCVKYHVILESVITALDCIVNILDILDLLWNKFYRSMQKISNIWVGGEIHRSLSTWPASKYWHPSTFQLQQYHFSNTIQISFRVALSPRSDNRDKRPRKKSSCDSCILKLIWTRACTCHFKHVISKHISLSHIVLIFGRCPQYIIMAKNLTDSIWLNKNWIRKCISKYLPSFF